MGAIAEPTTDAQKTFFRVLIESGGNISQAVEAAGISRQWAYELCRQYREYLNYRVEGVLSINGIRAATTLTEALDASGVDPGQKFKLEAAKDILDRIGVTKRQEMRVEVDGPTGIFFLPAKENVRDDQETD
jgi:hypothetical protein